MAACSRRASAPLLLLVLLTAISQASCVTREVLDSVYNKKRVEVILMEHRRGSQVIERDFTHPTTISEQRLSNLLGQIEIRGREQDLAGIRYVFEEAQLPHVAAALAFGLREANPDQAIAIRMTSKVVQHGIFDRRHITSFVSYVRDDLLFIHVSRVDWRVPGHAKKTAPPLPRVDEHPMKFQVIPPEGMYAEGIYAVSAEWQSPLFSKPRRRASAVGKGERTILLDDDSPIDPRESGVPRDALSTLSPDQLRALADLEEERQRGKITEGHYRHQRKKILDDARKSSSRRTPAE